MTKRAVLGLMLCAVMAPVVVAETYSVTLTSGAVLELQYPLQEAPWDKETLIFLSEGGNWVGVPRSEVVGVQIATEFKGYGELINATTIFMGLAANDQPVPGDPGEASATDRLFDVLNNLGRGQNYSSEQFVEPGEAGGGIPLNLVQPYTPQLGVPPIVPLGSGSSGGSASPGNSSPIVPIGDGSQ